MVTVRFLRVGVNIKNKPQIKGGKPYFSAELSMLLYERLDGAVEEFGKPQSQQKYKANGSGQIWGQERAEQTAKEERNREDSAANNIDDGYGGKGDFYPVGAVGEAGYKGVRGKRRYDQQRLGDR